MTTPHHPPRGRKAASTASSPRLPLWQQLQHAAQVVQAVVQHGQSAPVALAAVPANARAGVQAVAYLALRRWGVARALRQQLVPRSPPPLLDALLCVALALAWQDAPAADADASAAQPYTAFTLVHQAVEAARRHAGMRHHAAMVNAVLRRYLRESAHWHAVIQQLAPHGYPQLLNVPDWWLQRVMQDYGDNALAVIEAGAHTPPMTLRVNACHCSAQQYLAQHLRPAGLDGWCNGAYGVTLHRPVPVQQLPGFADGWVSVQDAAAQMAAPLLLHALQQHAPQRAHWRLLDACAAPGGKTAHVLEWLGAQRQQRGGSAAPCPATASVLALDMDAARCARIHQNLQRLRVAAGIQVDVQAADAAETALWWDGQLLEGIVLDAPCSASGIVRRHPDVPWLRRASDVAQLAAQQQRLLHALWPTLAPGGVLLYCTCSIFRQEGQAQIDAFLLHHSNAQALPAPGHLLPLHAAPATAQTAAATKMAPAPCASPPLSSGQAATQCLTHDGFFYALLLKTAAA